MALNITEGYGSDGSLVEIHRGFEIFALLGSYAACVGFLPTFRDSASIQFSRVSLSKRNEHLDC